MPGTYSTYESFPGRQHYVMVVPRTFGPIFFEGIQSMDAANNVNETTHGQYGFKSDVLIAKQYTNTSGSVALKDFNNASFVLRAMTGIEPTTSFIFDSSRLEPVDVFVNIFDDSRERVMRSCWYVDFTPNVTQNNTLDDIETLTLNYTAVRKIDFEGKQIVCQAFVVPGDPNEEPPRTEFQFKLKWKAVVDATVQTSTTDSVTGLATGTGRHDLCPFPYLLRVWVDGEVLDDPEAAQVNTVQTGAGTDADPYVLQSTLVLKTPAKAGTTVKAMWLADGADPVAQEGVTAAPVMVNAIVNTDGDPVAPQWQQTLRVFFSKSLKKSLLPSGTATTKLDPSDFEFTYDAAGVVTVIAPVSITDAGLSITDNVIDFDFTGAVPVGGGTAAPWPQDTEGVLCYKGTILEDTEGLTSPQHCITLKF